jgi:hypothetical protein
MFIFNNKVQSIEALSEDSQKSTIRFAFCSHKNLVYTNITAWVKCRDFLNDTFFVQNHTNITKEPAEIYVFGFKYKATIEKTLNTLAIIAHDRLELNRIKLEITKIINTLEKHIYPNYQPTSTLFDFEKHTNLPVLIVKPSIIWLTNTYTFSLFTGLLRFFTYEKLDNNIWMSMTKTRMRENTNDTSLVQLLEKKAELINAFLLNLTEVPNTKCDMSDNNHFIHDSLGIINSIYNTKVAEKLKSLETKPCHQDVKDVILF